MDDLLRKFRGHRRRVVYAFTDMFLDSLLTYGSAAAGVSSQTGDGGIAPINISRFCCRAGANPCDRRYFTLGGTRMVRCT